MHFTTSLKKNFEFSRVYNKGKSTGNKNLVVYCLKTRNNTHNTNRLGLSVSKKVGGSVVRSRVTRLIKESYRLKENRIKTGYHIVIVARANSKDASYHEIEAELEFLLKKHGLLLE